MTLTNLYSNVVPAGSVTVVLQRVFAAVCCPAERATAFAGFQLPSWGREPTSLIDCPEIVGTCSLNVMATAVAMAQAVVGVVLEVAEAVVAFKVVPATVLEIA